jgi:hypothetical protein
MVSKGNRSCIWRINVLEAGYFDVSMSDSELTDRTQPFSSLRAAIEFCEASEATLVAFNGGCRLYELNQAIFRSREAFREWAAVAGPESGSSMYCEMLGCIDEATEIGWHARGDVLREPSEAEQATAGMVGIDETAALNQSA